MTALHTKISAVLSALSIALERWASWHRARARHSKQLRLPLERMRSGRSRVPPPPPRELPKLILKVERPYRGPRTINVSLSITADEARRVVEGDRELTTEILDAVLTLILGAHRLAEKDK